MHSNPPYIHLGSLHQLMDRCLLLLATRDIDLAWMVMTDMSRSLEQVCANVDDAWSASLLSSVETDNSLGMCANSSCIVIFLISNQTRAAPDTVKPSLLVWESLKNLLFSSLITAQSHVNICAFHHAPRSAETTTFGVTFIAASTLRMLHHLSFIGARFGGVAADASGLPQQKRAFFGSLDILSSSPDAGEAFITVLRSMNGKWIITLHIIFSANIACY